MSSALVALPLLLAVALSPTPVAVCVLLALGKRPRADTAGFVAGWFTAVTVVLSLSAVGFAAFSDATSKPASSTRDTIELAVGVVLVMLGVVTLVLSRRASAQRDEALAEQRLLRIVGDVSSLRAALLGFVMAAVSPRQLLFLTPAGTHLATGSALTTALLVVGGAAVATLGVATPAVIARLGDSAELLARIRDWLTANGATVGGSVMVIVGLFLSLHAYGVLK